MKKAHPQTKGFLPKAQVGAALANRCLWGSGTRAESTATAKASRRPGDGQWRAGGTQTWRNGKAWRAVRRDSQNDMARQTC